ncbi:hypothetical protein Poli38472_001561 [Pythium oligandrum]|uniref:Uncharacterized protein n=1 Tax=Pythium oligandrum TaxID=41045 RepID=A0A8K1FMI6_PYTOL|nr:hypothetical protein Poli38472_001561 [Pythium oligandrum]|eukprot:TMW69405.1 hypothetical protein Poli38472_001561 [Pythium oligandrum]
MGGVFSKPTLFDAAKKGDLEMAKQCVENSADVNAADSSGETPLIIAVDEEHPVVLQFLLEKGADVDGKAAGGDTALIGAVELKNENIVNILLDHGANLNIRMRHVAAFLLLVLGGNDSPSAADIEKVITSFGGEVDSAKVETLLKELEGKNIDEVIEAGKAKLATVSVGAAPAGGAAAGGAAAEAPKEEVKEEEEEADIGGGMDMFGGGGSDY